MRSLTTLDRPSPNFDARPPGASVSLVVLHYTGMPKAEQALARLCDPGSRVSAHYLLDEDGTTYRLVSEASRAWHAGVAGWKQHDDVNAVSIGVELVNPGHEWCYRPFPRAQMDALSRLLRGICKRHSLDPRNIVGHSDVAPARKTDPGELFDWQGLANDGFGIWTSEKRLLSPDAHLAERRLAHIGYRFDLPDTCFRDVLMAFQRHFMPQRIDGDLDPELMGRIHAISAL